VEKKCKISEVAEILGLSVTAIRFYERRGLLEAEKDTANGYRYYREEDIDRLPGFRKQLPENSQPTPKGFQETLLNRLFNLLRESSSPLSASEAGRMLGISRSSARRYLEYLADEGEIAVQYEFTQVGRPRKLYSVHFRAKEGSV